MRCFHFFRHLALSLKVYGALQLLAAVNEKKERKKVFMQLY
jgi:hypothetical protein